MVTVPYPADSVRNLEIDTFWDGLFHSTTYVFVGIGLALLWRAARRTHVEWSGRMPVGTLPMGFGLFNLVEGVVNHHLLGIHHVNERVPPGQWVWWDIGFSIWGALMLVGGWLLYRVGRRRTAEGAPVPTP